MLSGMADAEARAVGERVGRMIFYLPITSRRDFRNALAYLARRLDENATPEGFLRHASGLRPGTEPWRDQAARFERAYAEREHVGTRPHQRQDRSVTAGPRAGDRDGWHNEPDTDLTVPANRRWAVRLLTGRRARSTATGHRGRGRTGGGGGPGGGAGLVGHAGRGAPPPAPRRRRVVGVGTGGRRRGDGGRGRQDLPRGRHRGVRSRRLRTLVRAGCRARRLGRRYGRVGPPRCGRGHAPLELPVRDPGRRGARGARGRQHGHRQAQPGGPEDLRAAGPLPVVGRFRRGAGAAGGRARRAGGAPPGDPSRRERGRPHRIDRDGAALRRAGRPAADCSPRRAGRTRW